MSRMEDGETEHGDILQNFDVFQFWGEKHGNIYMQQSGFTLSWG